MIMCRIVDKEAQVPIETFIVKMPEVGKRTYKTEYQNQTYVVDIELVEYRLSNRYQLTIDAKTTDDDY